MKKNRFSRIDSGMLSSYLGKWPTVLVGVIVIILAVCAWFLEPDYMAQVPVRVGVCAYDSASVSVTLEALADLIRTKGGGDITWVYFDGGTEPAGCDFYLLTSLQYQKLHERRGMTCSLIAGTVGGGLYSRGVVIKRPETGRGEISDGRLIFTTESAAAGFASAYAAMIDSGYIERTDTARIDFAGCQTCGERVVFAVLYGRYAAGGLSLDGYRMLCSQGVIGEDELEIVCIGEPVLEIIVAADRSIEDWKLHGFKRRFPAITEKLSEPLRTDLASIGIAGFFEAGEREIAYLDNLPTWSGE